MLVNLARASGSCYDASMSERFFVEQPITGSTAELVEAEAQHLAKVMRAAVGDEVVLFDGSGAEFAAKVARIAKVRGDA